MTQQLIKLPTGELGPTFLRIPPGTTKSQWAAIAQRVTTVGYGYQWWIGELAAYAMHNFENGDKSLQELCNATGYGRKQIRLFTYCVKKYPVKDRHANLSVSHHLAVLFMPVAKRSKLLATAAKRSWSVRELREHSTPREAKTILFTVRAWKADSQRVYKALQRLCKDMDCQLRVYGETIHRKGGQAKALRVISAAG